MAIETVAKLRASIHSVFAQGLRIAAPAEFDLLIRELASLKLEQPAALLKQVQERVANRMAAQKDVEALVKVLQILAQAEIRLSAATAVDLANLTAVHGVYLPPAEIPPTASNDLHGILQLPNKFVRGAQVAAYFKQASVEELTQSIAIAWFDYALSNAICEGLQARPADALPVAQIALGHKNPIIRRTALKVLANVGQNAAYTEETLKLLRNFLDRSTVPMVHFAAEIIARLEQRGADYLRSKRARFEQWAPTVKLLTSRAPRKRVAAANDLARIKDPCFTDALLRALAVAEERRTVKAILHALAEIGGFEAINELTPLLLGEHAPAALEALAKFGDRSVLAFLLSPAGINTPLSYYRDLLPQYGDLIVTPLLTAIKSLDWPGVSKAGWRNLFAALRPQGFAPVIWERIAHDGALAEKFAALMQRLYPKSIKKTDAQLGPDGTLAPVIKQLLEATFDGKNSPPAPSLSFERGGSRG